MMTLTGFPGVSNVVAANTGFEVGARDVNRFFDVTAQASELPVTLASAAVLGNGFTVYIRRNAASNVPVVISPASGQTIGGAATLTLTAGDETVKLVSDGANWHVVAHTGPQTADRFVLPVVAVEDIAAYSIVTTDGKAANSATVGDRGKILGVNPAAIANGFSGDVVLSGKLENPLWSWSPGGTLFLNGAVLSQTAPTSGFSKCMGVAKSATQILIEPQPAVRL